MISKYSVRRPFTVLVGVVLVIVLGVVSLTRMTADLLPDMSFPYVLIITTDVGAGPEEVETDVTAPIEAAMATTSNIKSISSVSYNSYSMVILEYEQNTNMDSTVIEIQQELSRLEGSFGDSAGTPIIMQIDPDMMPVMIAAVDVDGMDRIELSDYVDDELAASLESVEGVASVTVTGSVEEEIIVTLNQDKISRINKKISDAIDSQFDEAQDSIDDAESELNNGQAQIDSSSSQLQGAIDEAMGQREALYETESDLKGQLAELNSQKESLEVIQTAINEFIASDEYEELEALDEGIESLALMIEESGDILGEEFVTELQTEIDMYQATLDAANAEIAAQFTGLGEMGIKVSTYSDLADAAASVATMVTQVNTGIETIETALEQVKSGETTISDAIDKLNANAALAAIQVGSSAAQIAVAQSSLEDAQAELDSAKDSAKDSADLNGIITTDTITAILAAHNFSMPAGYVDDGDTEYLISVGDSVSSVEELENLVLMDMGMDDVGKIYLTDVADIEVTDDSEGIYAVINGNDGIMLSMEKQTGYSTGDVTDRLSDKFESLERENAELHLSVLMDQGVYIDIIVESVMQNMIFGAILAIIVLFLFLKDIKPTIIIACSIPLSVILAVVLMYFTGITMNIISMSGLALGIGMLVDNSIVVIENIYRLRDEGYSVKKAAVYGASQVTGAIIASTLTTVSVFAPIIFTEGITRQLFVDMGLTIAFTLAASLIIAMAFVPAAAATVLKNRREVAHPWFEKIRRAYAKVLQICLRFKPVVLIAAVLLLVVSTSAALSKGMTFMDMDVETDQLSVTITAKEDEILTFEELTAMSDEVIDRISDIEGIETIGAMSGGSSTISMLSGGSDSVSMYILLDENANVKLKDVTDEILSRTADMDCTVTADSSSMDYSAYFGTGLSIEIKGKDLDTLQSLAAQTAEILENTEGTIEIEDGLDDTVPEFRITVDKDKASEYGYTVAQVYQLVYSEMAESSSAATISTDLKDYEVYLQNEEQAGITLDDIRNLTFTYTNSDGDEEEIKLESICTFEEATSLNAIYRNSQIRYITVSCNVEDGYNVTLVSDKVEKELENIDIPDGYSISMEGEDATITDSMEQLALMLVLAVVFIYLIMVVQFQSLLSPFIIMFTIPLAFTGGFFALLMTGYEVSIIAMIGFIMLAGLIVNNGIVMVDYINRLRRGGMGKKEAIVEAGKTRLRPILMTAMTTILAMFTMAIGIGDGSEMMRPMAITMIGGLVYGTILTLVVVPCIYDIFNREKNMVEEEL